MTVAGRPAVLADWPALRFGRCAGEGHHAHGPVMEQGMELQIFVAETLKQIIDGVVDAQVHAKKKGAVVNPAGRIVSDWMSRKETKVRETDDPARGQSIEFDVAVTAGEGTQKKGGLGIIVGPVALGGQGQATANNQSVSRVKFAVPILLPAQKRPR